MPKLLKLGGKVHKNSVKQLKGDQRLFKQMEFKLLSIIVQFQIMKVQMP